MFEHFRPQAALRQLGLISYFDTANKMKNNFTPTPGIRWETAQS
jgi:hypothetical protein